jgi:hypothetical protein
LNFVFCFPPAVFGAIFFMRASVCYDMKSRVPQGWNGQNYGRGSGRLTRGIFPPGDLDELLDITNFLGLFGTFPSVSPTG